MPFIRIEDFSIPSENISYIELEYVYGNNYRLSISLKDKKELLCTTSYEKNVAVALLDSITKELNSFQLPKQA